MDMLGVLVVSVRPVIFAALLRCPWDEKGIRRGARVVDRVCLENRCAFTGTGGSNPSLSAFGRRSDPPADEVAGAGRVGDQMLSPVIRSP
jgi:hypothetical protein